MPDRIIVYEKPTCTTCRKLMALLREDGIDYEPITPIAREKLVELIEKMGITPRELLRTRHPAYKELGLGSSGVSDDAILDAMAEHPELVQRPIVERGPRAVLARPPEKVRELFD